MKKAYFLSVKYTPEKSAAAVIGVTFGTCGTKRNKMAIPINEIRIICFLLKEEPIINVFNNIFKSNINCGNNKIKKSFTFAANFGSVQF